MACTVDDFRMSPHTIRIHLDLFKQYDHVFAKQTETCVMFLHLTKSKAILVLLSVEIQTNSKALSHSSDGNSLTWIFSYL